MSCSTFTNVGGISGAAPMLVLDVYEHAYYHKFGPDRAAYIQAFLDNVDWGRPWTRCSLM